MAINMKFLLLCVILYCQDVCGRSVPSCEGGKVWSARLHQCECPLWTYWYDPTHGCEQCSQLCKGGKSLCEARIECSGYLQSLTSPTPSPTVSAWTDSSSGQKAVTLTDLTSWQLAIIVMGVVQTIVVMAVIYLGWTVRNLKMGDLKMSGDTLLNKMKQSHKDPTVEKTRYEPDGALTDEARRSTQMQADAQETEGLLPHAAATAQDQQGALSASEDDGRHIHAIATEPHKPSVNEILQQHHDAENSYQ